MRLRNDRVAIHHHLQVPLILFVDASYAAPAVVQTVFGESDHGAGNR